MRNDDIYLLELFFFFLAILIWTKSIFLFDNS